MTKQTNQSKTITIVIASKNLHKIREVRSILGTLSNIDFLSLLDFPSYHPPEETGNTFEENAILKANHAAKALNHWTIADDSGLVVPALNSSPGIYSARYAGPNATDKDNRKKLLNEMRKLTDDDRYAYFECIIALASPHEIKKTVRGICEGTVLTQEKGSNGFGYDPLFVKHQYSKTFAELEESIKNRISHRRKALDKIKLTLETLK
jgi:XTP/dITP diphosphohydrolase